MKKMLRRCDYSDELIKDRPVILVKYILDYVRKQGYLVSNFPLKIFLFILLTLILVPLSSAGRYYDSGNNILSVTDGNGDLIYKSQLLTPLDNPIIDRGEGVYQLVAEFDLNLTSTKSNFLDEILFNNIGKQNVLTRNYLIKSYQPIGLAYEPIYEKYCNPLNASECFMNKTGKELVVQYDWMPFSMDLVSDGYYQLGLFVDVKKGENVEWVPSFLGAPVPEWATWNETFNVGLFVAWDFEEASGDLIDIIDGTSNGTAKGTPARQRTGIINYSNYFDGTTESFNVSDSDEFDFDQGTFSFWLYRNDSTADILSKRDTGSAKMWEFDIATSQLGGFVYEADSNQVALTRTTMHSDVWQHYVIVLNGTDIVQYRNGTEVAKDSYDGDVQTDSNAVLIAEDSRGSNHYNGMIDEMYIWNRSLAPNEVNDLFNGGLGLHYDPMIGSDTFPYFDTIPTELNHTYPAPSFTVLFNASDDNGIDTWWHNYSDLWFYINQSGAFNNSKSLSAGVYEINVSVNDTIDQINSTFWTYTISKNTTLVLSVSASSPITYPTVTNVVGSGCPAQLSCTLDNANGVYAVGSQVFNYSTAGNENFTAKSDTVNVTININSTAPHLYLGTTQNNVTINNNTAVDYLLNGTFPYQSTRLRLYLDTVLINVGIDELSNLTTLVEGVYNVTLQNNESQNYSETFTTYWLTVVNATGGSDEALPRWFVLDLDNTLVIVILVILFITVGLAFYLQAYVISGGLLSLIGLILLISDFNPFISILFLLGGVLIGFILKRGNS